MRPACRSVMPRRLAKSVDESSAMDVSHAFSSTCKRHELFEAEDEIYRQRGEMITGVEARLRQTSRRQPAFRVRWQMV